MSNPNNPISSKPWPHVSPPDDFLTSSPEKGPPMSPPPNLRELYDLVHVLKGYTRIQKPIRIESFIRKGEPQIALFIVNGEVATLAQAMSAAASLWGERTELWPLTDPYL